MQLPESIWNKLALAALAAGTAGCAPSASPSTSPAGGTAHAVGNLSPTEATAGVEPGDTGCETRPPDLELTPVDLFLDGCPMCGMG